MPIATGMPTDSAPSSSRDGTLSSSSEDGEQQLPAGALSTEVLQLLIPARREVNEDGEVVLEEEQPPLPTTLAPAFSKENLDALRAERMARRAAAGSSPPPIAVSARPSPSPAKVAKKLTSARGDSPSKALRSHRSGTSTNRSDEKDKPRTKPKASAGAKKSHRGAGEGGKRVHLSLTAQPPIAEMIELEA